MPSVEELEAQLSAAQARLTEVNSEAKGHRLNAANARTEAEAARAEAERARKEAADHAADIGKKMAEAEAAAAAKIAEESRKASDAMTAAQQRAMRADLRIAAKDAGAQDAADVLALLDVSKVKLDENGDVTNGAELMAALKASKPYLFGGVSTSSTAPVPEKKPAVAKSAKEMTDDEFKIAMRNKAWRG